MKNTKKTKLENQLFQIKITLRNSPLPIWRRLLIKGGEPLAMVHELFQVAMGWTNNHYHDFKVAGKVFSDIDAISDDSVASSHKIEDESDYFLCDLFQEPGECIEYEYDWGDSWIHDVELEKVSPAKNCDYLARCVAGKRACPPEDVGGIHGYANFVDAIEDPEHPEHEAMLSWIGCQFDPDSFDPRLVNMYLEEMKMQLEAFSDLVGETLPELLGEMMAAEQTSNSKPKPKSKSKSQSQSKSKLSIVRDGEPRL